MWMQSASSAHSPNVDEYLVITIRCDFTVFTSAMFSLLTDLKVVDNFTNWSHLTYKIPKSRSDDIDKSVEFIIIWPRTTKYRHNGSKSGWDLVSAWIKGYIGISARERLIICLTYTCTYTPIRLRRLFPIITEHVISVSRASPHHINFLKREFCTLTKLIR